jgi:outer membrane murein-binding lipoprotein Lpp
MTVLVQELEAVHAEKKAIYAAAVGGLEGVVSKLKSSVADLQKEVEAASSDLARTRSRVQDLEGHVQRMHALGADELKRRSVLATWDGRFQT